MYIMYHIMLHAQCHAYYQFQPCVLEDAATVIPCALWYEDDNIILFIEELIWICIKELNCHGI